MRFELKIRYAFHESFHSTEELFEFLRREQVTFELYGNIKPHEVPDKMTYLGDVEYVGFPYRYEKALYVQYYTDGELEVLKVELSAIQKELAEKWKEKLKKVPA